MTRMLNETFYLVLSRRRNFGMSARVTAKPPSLKSGEIVLSLQVSLPESLFARPSLRAKVEVPEASSPPVIDAGVTDNIAAILTEQLGYRVTVEVDAPEPADD